VYKVPSHDAYSGYNLRFYFNSYAFVTFMMSSLTRLMLLKCWLLVEGDGDMMMMRDQGECQIFGERNSEAESPHS